MKMRYRVRKITIRGGNSMWVVQNAVTGECAPFRDWKQALHQAFEFANGTRRTVDFAWLPYPENGVDYWAV